MYRPSLTQLEIIETSRFCKLFYGLQKQNQFFLVVSHSLCGSRRTMTITALYFKVASSLVRLSTLVILGPQAV